MVLNSAQKKQKQKKKGKKKKNWVTFLRAGKKVEISNFISLFCLKDKLFEQDHDTASSCPESERRCKDSAKSESWFPIQPTKKL